MNKSENPGEENQVENLDTGFTVKEVASFIDETPNVIRNWFKELRDYIPHEKNSNGYNVYKKAGIDRFKEVQALHREQNWSMKQIEHYFATGGESFKPEPEKSAGEVLAEEIKILNKKIDKLTDHAEKQEQFNEALVEQNKSLFEQLQALERGTNERDKKLMASLREVQTKQLIAATNEPDFNLDNQDKKPEPQKKGLFARLFGR